MNCWRRTQGSVMISQTARTICIALGIALCMVIPADAQLSSPKPPHVGYVFPPVIKIGATTEVTLGGFDWTDDLQWFVHDPRVKLETYGSLSDYHLPPPPYWEGVRASIGAPPIPREIAGRLVCPADVPPGPVYWQVANANGSSSTALVYLTNSPEVVESRSRDLPQQLSGLPVSVSGRLSRLTEVDRYEVIASRDGILSVDLQARRLGSDFLGVIEVHDAANQLLADYSDSLGVDGAVSFAAKGGETYTVALHDVDFRGDRAYVYRLTVSEGPRAITTLPACGQVGTTIPVEFVGIGLATGAAREETVTQPVTFPPAGPATSHKHVVQTAFGPVEFDIPLSTLPEHVPSAVAPTDGNARMLLAPGAVTGRLAPDQHEARYVWESAEKEWWSIRALSQAIRGSLDVSVQILDPQGKPISDNDDRGGTSDAGMEFQAAAAGRYTAIIRSMSPQTRSLREVYRLEVNRLAPDFRLMAPLQIDLPLAGKVDVKLTVQRLAGFNGPIAVTADGLPRGAAASGEWTIPEGKNELTATITAAADADVVASVVRFQGKASINGAEIVHPADVQFEGSLAPVNSDELRRTESMLSVTMPAPFEIKVVDRESQHDIHRGSTYLADLQIVRQPGFTGDLSIAMSGKQDRTRKGIRGSLVPVPADATQFYYPTFMPEWLATDLTCRIVVHGVGAVPDPQGRIRYLTRAGDARITMIMEGALLKLECPTPQLLAAPGDELKIPIAVSRSVKLPLPTTVEFEIPEELKGLVECDPLTLAADTREGTLTIRTKADPRLHGQWNWTLRATSLQDHRWPVVSQFDLDVLFQNRSQTAMP